MKEKTRFYSFYNTSIEWFIDWGVLLVLVTLLILPKEVFANTAYVTFYDKNRVGKFDTNTNTVIPGYILVGINPNAITITPDGTTAYLTNSPYA